MYLYHVNVTYVYHCYDFIVSAKDKDSAIERVEEYMNNFTSKVKLFNKRVVYLSETINEELFYEINR